MTQANTSRKKIQFQHNYFNPFIILSYTMLCYTRLDWTGLYCTILNWTILYCMYYTIPYSSSSNNKAKSSLHVKSSQVDLKKKQDVPRYVPPSVYISSTRKVSCLLYLTVHTIFCAHPQYTYSLMYNLTIRTSGLLLSAG